MDIERLSTVNKLNVKSKEVKQYKQNELKEMFEDEKERVEDYKNKHFLDILAQLKDELKLDKKELQERLEDPVIIEKIKNNTLTNEDKETISNRQYEVDRMENFVSLYGSGEKNDIWLAYNKDEVIDDSVYPKYIQNNIKLLNIQPDKVGEYETILTDNHKITNHFRIVKFFFKEESDILEKLELKKDYSCKKGASSDFKIIFLKKVLKELGVEEYSLDPDCSNISHDKSEKLLDEYRVVFTDRNKKKKISFENEKEAQQLIVKMYKNIFGADIIKSKKSTKTTDNGVKSITYYNLNMEQIALSQELYAEGGKRKCAYDSQMKLYSKIVY